MRNYKKNPYVQNANSKLIPSFICYADILGFKESSMENLEKGNGNHFLNRIRNSLNKAYGSIRGKKTLFNIIPEFNLKVFTDNLVIGFPVPDYKYNSGEHALGSIYRIFSEYQTNLAMDGFFVRGAITFGDFFMDSNIVFGDPLLEAIELEKDACFPRIILSKKATEMMYDQVAYYGNPKHSPQYNDFLNDNDNQIFLNYLNVAFSIFPDNGDIFFEVIEKHKKHVESNLLKYNKKLHVLEKYQWLARYHNFICQEVAERYPISYDPDQPLEHGMAAASAQRLLDYLIEVAEGPCPSRLIF
ncbi:MAG TPA: hypothetical protein DCW42_04190 [Bacteroidetes bacterium]|nr:hypothetical protein [Bacteroidota bacterium]